jgi:hypothetical protein
MCSSQALQLDWLTDNENHCYIVLNKSLGFVFQVFCCNKSVLESLPSDCMELVFESEICDDFKG